MFCPICKAEYRRGFTHCADCDVDLVATHQTKADQDATGDLCVVWEGPDQGTCVRVCATLQNLGIRYAVQQIPSGHPGMRVDWQYRIGVLLPDCERAREMVREPGVFDVPDPEELDGPSPLELPDEEPTPLPKAFHRDWDPDNWFPEDATVEVWSDKDGEHSSWIEMILKENRIHVRTELNNANLKACFVLPGDETRAREIIQEVVEGRPPA